MLKFIKHHMESIVGIEVFPLISFIIFFIFFITLFVWVALLRKDHINQLSNMPFEDNTDQNQAEV
ncbi:MAG: CcoQ/FixQ family Cbb3-type cytochrome c oxidase assembly chaperone [Flavobacteriales bacterium]|nr:CcoQ/FixQ family Cbb3-type cytochrome c oxidase assembly chaperone [Flavobacteriales bacterium]|tara:strand:- start:12 stop:206 length:195 start_codon:yes stop_codon:yes gene_type:complete